MLENLEVIECMQQERKKDKVIHNINKNWNLSEIKKFHRKISSKRNESAD